MNVDPLQAVTTARGALPQILHYRESISRLIPSFNLENIDRLEIYALALMQAHTYFLATLGQPKDRTRLAREGIALREQMLSDIVVLKKRKFFKGIDLATLKGPNGHANVASDLSTLATMVRDEWEQVSRVSPITLDELDHAERLSDELIRAIGVSTRVPEAVAFARQQRARTFTLFMRAYNQVRCAITFIRSGENDIEKLVPSLYRKKTSRKNQTFHIEETDTTPSSTENDPFFH